MALLGLGTLLMSTFYTFYLFTPMPLHPILTSVINSYSCYLLVAGVPVGPALCVYGCWKSAM